MRRITDEEVERVVKVIREESPIKFAVLSVLTIGQIGQIALSPEGVQRAERRLDRVLQTARRRGLIQVSTKGWVPGVPR